MKTLEDRLTQAGDELRHAADRMPPREAPEPQPLRSALAFAVGVVSVLLPIAVPAWLLSGTGSDDPSVADMITEGEAGASEVFVLPGFVPDGFHLVRGLMVDARSEPVSDPDEAAGVVLQYLRAGQFSRRPDEPWLFVHVSDHLAVMAWAQADGPCFADDGTEIECDETARPSACAGDPAMAANRMDPEACMDETERRGPESYGGTAVDYERTTVRDLPAHIVRVGGGDDFDLSITTYEGGPILSEVTGNEVAEEDLLQVAETLRPVSPGAFEAAVNVEAADSPESFYAGCMADAGFEIIEVQIGRTIEGVQFPRAYLDDPGYAEARRSCVVALYEEYGIPVYPESARDGATSP